MKKIIYLIIVLLVGTYNSKAQALRGKDLSVNRKNYPSLPLANNSIYLNLVNMANVEQYGITQAILDSLFAINPAIKIVSKQDAAYVLTLNFGIPKATDQGMTSFTKMNIVEYQGVAECDFPIKATLMNSAGHVILPEEIISQIVTLKGKSSNIASDAKKNWESYYLKHKNQRIAEVGIKNIKTYLTTFLTDHYVCCSPYTFEWQTIWPNKKFPNEGYKKCTDALDSIAKIMKPNESLMDYPALTKDIIEFFKQELTTFDPYKKSNWKLSNACSFNLMHLYTLTEEYDSLQTIYPIIENFSMVKFMVTDNKKEISKTLENKQKYMSGYRIDADFSQEAINEQTKDSLKRLPSKVTVYLQDNNILETTAILFPLRPGFVNESNIYDLSFGETLKVVDPKTYQPTTSISAKNIKKVVAGNEVYYPLKFGAKLNQKLVYVYQENDKAFFAIYKDTYIFQRKDIEDNINITTVNMIGSKKRIIEYFDGNPKVKSFIDNNKHAVLSTEDMIEIVKLYGE